MCPNQRRVAVQRNGPTENIVSCRIARVEFRLLRKRPIISARTSKHIHRARHGFTVIVVSSPIKPCRRTKKRKYRNGLNCRIDRVEFRLLCKRPTISARTMTRTEPEPDLQYRRLQQLQSTPYHRIRTANTEPIVSCGSFAWI